MNIQAACDHLIVMVASGHSVQFCEPYLKNRYALSELDWISVLDFYDQYVSASVGGG